MCVPSVSLAKIPVLGLLWFYDIIIALKGKCKRNPPSLPSGNAKHFKMSSVFTWLGFFLMPQLAQLGERTEHT